jgi:hypothetical protein
MLTNVPPPQTIPHQPGQRRRKRFNILALPIDVLLMLLKEHLNVFDRAAFALVCKAFAQQVVSLPSLLQPPASLSDEYQEEMTVFFRKRMKSWFPGKLKYCQNCGKYVPKDDVYWKETLERDFARRPGKLAGRFLAWKAMPSWAGLEDCVRSWKLYGRALTCPRCKLYRL